MHLRRILLAGAASVLLSGPALAAYIGTPPLLVPNGGTGATTLTAHGSLIGEGAGAIVALSPVAGTVLYQSSASADPAMSATPVLGVAGTTLGTLGLAGNTSGTVTIEPAAAAGTYDFVLPITAGSAGQLLLSQGGGSTAMTWTNPCSLLSAGTGISISGTTTCTITNTGSGGTNPSETTYTGTSPYSPAATNLLTSVISQGTPAAITVNLPASQAAGFRQCIKDGTNNFATHNATIKVSAGNIDGTLGTTGIVMNQAHQELCFISDGTGYWIE